MAWPGLRSLVGYLQTSKFKALRAQDYQLRASALWYFMVAAMLSCGQVTWTDPIVPIDAFDILDS